jgi:hypothetical protein
MPPENPSPPRASSPPVSSWTTHARAETARVEPLPDNAAAEPQGQPPALSKARPAGLHDPAPLRSAQHGHDRRSTLASRRPVDRLADLPEPLENHQHPSSSASVAENLQAQITALDRKITGLVAAAEAGADLPQLTDQLRRRPRERAGLEAQLRAFPQERRLSAEELRAAIEDMGGIAKCSPAPTHGSTPGIRVAKTTSRIRSLRQSHHRHRDGSACP